MGEINTPKSAMLLVAVSSRYDSALAWAEQTAVAEFGPLYQKSEAFDFTETDYYRESMGTALKKQFLTFETLIDPGTLPRVKRLTNDWERLYLEQHDHAESRPLNLDPGYLTMAKLVLASTKDHSHRIYLAEGIYAEITLTYRKRGWQKSEWTYPDYQREDFQAFFTSCRQELRDRAN